MEGYGKIMRQLRGKKSPQEVAEALGIAVSTLYAYESEQRRPTDAVKMRISEYYKRSIKFIFFSD